jgi:hypothetical protein
MLSDSIRVCVLGAGDALASKVSSSPQLPPIDSRYK